MPIRNRRQRRLGEGSTGSIRRAVGSDPLAEARHAYDIVENTAGGCEKVVLKP